MNDQVPSMRVNPVRERLRGGGTAFGVMAFEFFTPGLAPTLAAAGAEFVILDMEHSGVSIETIKAQIAYAHGAGIVPMVRVTACVHHLIAPVLDVAAAANKPMGFVAPNGDAAQLALQRGFRCICIGHEVAVLRNALTQEFAKARKGGPDTP